MSMVPFGSFAHFRSLMMGASPRNVSSLIANTIVLGLESDETTETVLSPSLVSHDFPLANLTLSDHLRPFA
jgi:hypothetical protein